MNMISTMSGGAGPSESNLSSYWFYSNYENESFKEKNQHFMYFLKTRLNH